MEDDEEIGLWFWAIAVAIGAAGLALAVAIPGDFAYWLAPLLVLVPLWMVTVQFLTPWPAVPVRTRAAAWVGGVALAAGGVGLVILTPDPQTYLFAMLLLMPFIAVLLARQGDDDDRRNRGPDVPGGTDPGPDIF